MDSLLNNGFDEYYKQYYSKVIKYILKRVDDDFLAEDIAMDTFTSIYKHFSEFDPKKASFATWLHVILNNKIKNYYRDNKVVEELEEKQVAYVYFESDIIHNQYINELRNELEKAMRSLGKVQRKIIYRKYYEGQTAEKIGNELGLTAINVRVQLSRALVKLRKYFDKEGIKLE